MIKANNWFSVDSERFRLEFLQFPEEISRLQATGLNLRRLVLCSIRNVRISLLMIVAHRIRDND